MTIENKAGTETFLLCSYECMVRASSVDLHMVQSKLSRAERIECVSVAGAMSSEPTSTPERFYTVATDSIPDAHVTVTDRQQE